MSRGRKARWQLTQLPPVVNGSWWTARPRDGLTQFATASELRRMKLAKFGAVFQALTLGPTQPSARDRMLAKAAAAKRAPAIDPVMWRDT